MNRLTSAVMTALLVGMSASSSFAAEQVSVNTPTISQSKTHSDLISRSGNAVHDYVLAHADAGARLSSLWVFPTAGANTVFVRYSLDGSSAEHLLLVEMNGAQIAKLRDLTTEVDQASLADADF